MIVDESLKNGERPNSKLVQERLAQFDGVRIARRRIRRILRSLGYFYDKVSFLPAYREQPAVRAKRYEYLETISILRRLKPNVVFVYFDETYVHESAQGGFCYFKGKRRMDRVIASSKGVGGGRRICVVHAASSEEGLIPGASLIGYAIEGREGKKQNTVNEFVFMRWFEMLCQVMARKYGSGPRVVKRLPRFNHCSQESGSSAAFTELFDSQVHFPAEFGGQCITNAGVCRRATQWWEERSVGPMVSSGRRRLVVFVFDNASYHTAYTEDFRACPTSSTKKAEMIEWLLAQRRPKDVDRARDVLEGLTKTQIYGVVREEKAKWPVWSRFEIERIAAEFGFLCLRTPPYHPEFQPIELCWSQVKYQVRERQLTGGGVPFSKLPDVIREEFGKFSFEGWKDLERHVEAKEEMFRSERPPEELVNLVVSFESDEDEEDDEDGEDEQEADAETDLVQYLEDNHGREEWQRARAEQFAAEHAEDCARSERLRAREEEARRIRSLEPEGQRRRRLGLAEFLRLETLEESSHGSYFRACESGTRRSGSSPKRVHDERAASVPDPSAELETESLRLCSICSHPACVEDRTCKHDDSLDDSEYWFCSKCVPDRFWDDVRKLELDIEDHVVAIDRFGVEFGPTPEATRIGRGVIMDFASDRDQVKIHWWKWNRNYDRWVNVADILFRVHGLPRIPGRQRAATVSSEASEESSDAQTQLPTSQGQSRGKYVLRGAPRPKRSIFYDYK